MDESSLNAIPRKARVLLVDDEESILSSLRRLLRSQSYELFLADSGMKALEIMQEQPIDLVISDARMPNMDGATLLATIRERYPQTFRILLTGYADLDMIAKAINEGQIYRYLSKPWDDQELLLTVAQALAHQQSEVERKRLVALTREQNEQLQALNAGLEKRVQARTAEIEQTADMLDLAYEELKRNYAVTAEVFSRMVESRLPKEKQTNRPIIELIRAYCSAHVPNEADSRNLSIAAALHNIGKVSWTDAMMSAPAEQLHHTEREKYRAYPAHSETLLMTLDPMKDATRLIRSHQERWDGTGFPDHLKGTAIPLGSRLLKLAVDFIELQRGLILERRMNADEALLFIRKYAGKLYDPDLVEGFIKVCADHTSDVTMGDPAVKAVTTRELVAGMILARNLNADNGMLLLNAGKQLTALLVEKLISFESMEAAKYTIFVKLPEEAAVQGATS
jgi:response regulator RpfG family c-di-GMP phosphodiesterase